MLRRYRDDLDVDCKKCRHFDQEENNCTAFVCVPFMCDAPLPCEIKNNHIKPMVYGVKKRWKV